MVSLVGWFFAACILMSFIEHQVHSRLMHKQNWLSLRTAAFEKTFKAHAVVHHKHYSKIFSDEPVPPGEDREIRMNPGKGMLKAIPIAVVLSLLSWKLALLFVPVVGLHHWIWNKIHLEMHKPEKRSFSNWAAYKFLARYHCLHHRYPDKNFNVVFPFADYILGTHVRMTPAEEIYLKQFNF